MSAKKEGNAGLAYVYKILMNSLYGRFGINPRCTITEICSNERYKHVLRKSGFLYGWGEELFICSYFSYTLKLDEYAVPRNAAVQIAAAITAYARIHMHPYTI